MTRIYFAAFAAMMVAAAPLPARAQSAPPDTRGHVVSKKKVADCKAQAKAQKLTHGKRRKFMRVCVET